jgi:hypothetical protein
MPPTPELFPAGEGTPLAFAEGSDAIEIPYEAGGAYATIDGQGTIRVSTDGGPAREVAVDGAGIYELAAHPRHEAHALLVEFVAGDMSIWSISFAPGVP